MSDPAIVLVTQVRHYVGRRRCSVWRLGLEKKTAHPQITQISQIENDMGGQPRQIPTSGNWGRTP
jgi:hypothetical protein